MTVADFVSPTPFAQSITVATAANDRIRSTDPNLLMPPPNSVAPLNAQQIAVLSTWLEGGAQASANSCAVLAP